MVVSNHPHMHGLDSDGRAVEPGQYQSPPHAWVGHQDVVCPRKSNPIHIGSAFHRALPDAEAPGLTIPSTLVFAGDLPA